MNRIRLSALIITVLAASANAQHYGGGSGEPDDPYQIKTAVQMNEIGLRPEDWDKHFILMNDIDLSIYTGRQFNCIGKEQYMTLSKPFSGVFDGNDKAILGFTYEDTDVAVVAMFRGVGAGGIIRNLGLVNPSVRINVSPSCDWVLEVACLVATLMDDGTIENCWVENGRAEGFRNVGLLTAACAGTIMNCRVTGTVAGSEAVGGIAGLHHGVVERCVFQGTVESMDYAGGICGYNRGIVVRCGVQATVSGIYAVGGICGLNSRTITDSYALGDVNGTRHVGGLAGMNAAIDHEGIPRVISNSFAANSVSGDTDTGAFVGEDYNEIGHFTACFWDASINPALPGIGNSTDPHVTGKTTEQMQQQTTFTGWDFTSIWMIIGNQTYPYLRSTAPYPGAGTGEDPYQIRTAEQLKEIGLRPEDWNKHFILMNDIDMWGAAVPVRPIGMWHRTDDPVSIEQVPFTGVFDGNGKCIVNGRLLFLPGLFGYIAEPGEVRNLGISLRIWADYGYQFAGVLAGYLRGGKIHNCWTEGARISGCNAGGLVGWNEGGHISGCRSSCDVMLGYGDDRGAGGLVGRNTGGTIVDCSATGNVSGPLWLGGLVGKNEGGVIRNCSAAGAVGDGDSTASISGGLVGVNISGEITDCRASGCVRSNYTWDYFLGGLVGSNDGGAIVNCHATGEIYSRGNGVGGLVGRIWLTSQVTGCTSSGKVSGFGNVGGLLGRNTDGIVTDCTSSSEVTGGGSVGGLVGCSERGRHSNCWYTGKVTGGGGVGGAFGVCTGGEVVDVHSRANVTGRGVVGGLIGSNSANVWRCSFEGLVTALQDAGGLIGSMGPATLEDCYADASVWCNGNAGGIAGSSRGDIRNSYAAGEVVTVQGAAGGLLGSQYADGAIRKCYSAVEVLGNGALAGLACTSSLNIFNSFWDQSINPLLTGTGQQTDPPGARAASTTEMMTVVTFLSRGWDFVGETANGTDDIWRMDPEQPDYPRLAWQPDAAPDGDDRAETHLQPLPYNGGTGTPEDPYLINTPEQFMQIGLHPEDWDKHFALTTDISMKRYEPSEWNPIGSWEVPFTGVFDGHGHKISEFRAHAPVFAAVAANGLVQHLTMVDPVLRAQQASVAALVGYLGDYNGPDARVFDCHVINADIRGPMNDHGYWDVGAIVATNNGEIRRCSATGSVLGRRNAGGLVGATGCFADIRESFSLCRVAALIEKAGGLVGDNHDYGRVKDCYAQGPVLGSAMVGGLVGDNGDLSQGGITTSYSTGLVPDYAYGKTFGGLVGRGKQHAQDSSFWDRSASGCSFSAEGRGLSTSEMQTLTTYPGEWDFVAANDGYQSNIQKQNDVWRLCKNGADYPRLSWEFARVGDFTCPDGVGMEDLLYLAERWLAVWSKPRPGAADVNGDYVVNMYDLAVLAGNWVSE